MADCYISPLLPGIVGESRKKYICHGVTMDMLVLSSKGGDPRQRSGPVPTYVEEKPAGCYYSK